MPVTGTTPHASTHASGASDPLTITTLAGFPGGSTNFLREDGTFAPPPGAGGGEANTASNVGAAGVGVFDAKVGVDLQFKKLNAASTKITITNDAVNHDIDFDIAADAVVAASTDSRLGWTFLGSAKLGAAAATTGAVTIAARDALLILVRITGYGGGDIASFRFNADTGANYWSRYLSSVAGGVTLVNNQNVSQTLARIFAATTTLQRSAIVHVTNNQTTSKLGSVSGQTGSGAAGTAGIVEMGGFEWVNTAAQITSIEMRTAGGANMNAGSGFAVFGRNF